MQKRAWVALALVVLAIAFATAGRAVPGLQTLAGALLLVAIVIGVTLIPAVARLRERMVPMPGLFAPVPVGQRWCDRCGRATPPGPCRGCGHEPPARKAKGRKAGRAPAEAPVATLRDAGRRPGRPGSPR